MNLKRHEAILDVVKSLESDCKKYEGKEVEFSTINMGDDLLVLWLEEEEKEDSPRLYSCHWYKFTKEDKLEVEDYLYAEKEHILDIIARWEEDIHENI